MADTAGQWHAPSGCYGQHRRPVARSNCLLWPTPQMWFALVPLGGEAAGAGKVVWAIIMFSMPGFIPSLAGAVVTCLWRLAVRIHSALVNVRGKKNKMLDRCKVVSESYSTSTSGGKGDPLLDFNLPNNHGKLAAGLLGEVKATGKANAWTDFEFKRPAASVISSESQSFFYRATRAWRCAKRTIGPWRGALQLASLWPTPQTSITVALVGCCGQHHRPVARSNWLLWPTSQGQWARGVALSNCLL